MAVLQLLTVQDSDEFVLAVSSYLSEGSYLCWKKEAKLWGGEITWGKGTKQTFCILSWESICCNI